MLLRFVKFQVKSSNFDGMTKRPAVNLDFGISQGSVATPVIR